MTMMYVLFLALCANAVPVEMDMAVNMQVHPVQRLLLPFANERVHVQVLTVEPSEMKKHFNNHNYYFVLEKALQFVAGRQVHEGSNRSGLMDGINSAISGAQALTGLSRPFIFAIVLGTLSIIVLLICLCCCCCCC